MSEVLVKFYDKETKELLHIEYVEKTNNNSAMILKAKLQASSMLKFDSKKHFVTIHDRFELEEYELHD